MLRSTLLLLSLSVVLTACNEDKPTARKSLGGVDGQRALHDLDDDQLERVCDAADDKIATALDQPGAHEGGCLLVAHVTARGMIASDESLDEAEVCEESLDLCSDESANSYGCLEAVAERCDATVADFDHCITLANDLYVELGALDCDDVSGEDTEDLDARIQASVDACDRLAVCFISDDMPDGGDGDGDGDASVVDAGELDSSTPDDDAGR